MRLSFANRVAEIRDIRSFLEDGSRDGDRVCVVSGPSGIGKSRLVDEAAAMAPRLAHTIRVHVRQSDYRCGESGFFLRTSAVAVSECCKSENWGLSLEHYAHTKGGVDVLKNTFAATAKKVERLTSGDSDLSSDLMAAWTQSATTLKELLGEPSTPALKLAFDYLEKALADGESIIIIENSQRIDSESLHYLHSLLDRVPDLKMVYEFTTSHEPSSTQMRPYGKLNELVAACLADNFGVCEVALSALDFDALAGANFKNIDRRFAETLRAELQKSNGNVRDVERLHDIAGKRADDLAVGGIETTIVGYTSQQKLVLWVVALARKALDPYELSQIIRFIPDAIRPNAPAEIAKSLAPFLECRNGLFSVDHDSLLQKLNSIDQIRKECLVAASAVAGYFRSFLEVSDFSQYSEYEVLFALLWANLNLNDEGLVDVVIGRLAERSRASGRPASLLKLVQDFALKSDRRPMHNATVRRLIHIVYDACWVEGAIDLVRRHRAEAPDIRLCYCQALAIAGHHDAAEKELEEARAAIAASEGSSVIRKGLNAYANLTGALIARVRGDYKIARSRYSELRPSDFATQEGKCVFYRFAEAVGAVDARKQLVEAVKIARKIADPVHFIRSALCLAMIETERGATTQAIELLDEADAYRVTNYIDTYMCANNRLVTELFMGKPPAASYRSLCDCLPLIVESMDRLLVMNNLMAAATDLGDSSSAARFAQCIEESLERIVEPNMRRISFFNCSRYFSALGSVALAQDYFDRAFSVVLDFDQIYWSARRAGVTDQAVDFRLGRVFDLPMMSNWYFTWPDFSATPE